MLPTHMLCTKPQVAALRGPDGVMISLVETGGGESGNED